MKIFSGDCVKCDVGIPTGHVDCKGKPLFTGDIVILYAVYWPGTDTEYWSCCGMTAIVANQYQSFMDGTIKYLSKAPAPFVMGIATSGFTDDSWKIQKVKHYQDVVQGEHWQDYGFRYGKSIPADFAKEGLT